MKSAMEIRKAQEQAETERQQKAKAEMQQHADAQARKKEQAEQFDREAVERAMRQCENFIERANEVSSLRGDTVPAAIQAVVVAKFKEIPTDVLLKPLAEMLKASGYDTLKIRQKRFYTINEKDKIGSIGNVIPFNALMAASKSGIAPTQNDGVILVMQEVKEGYEVCCYVPPDFEYDEHVTLVAARW